MKSGDRENIQVSEEAALWLQRLEQEDSPEVHKEFSEWLRGGALHVQEFLFAQAVWKEFDHIDADTRAKVDAAQASGAVIEFPQPHAPEARSKLLPSSMVSSRCHGRWRWVTAAGVAIVALGALALRLAPGAETYVTAIGGQESVKLDDGSVVHLNTDSRVRVQYSEHQRLVRLLEGEALFTVESDPSRPFVVLTDDTRIRALGTQFNVYRNASSVTRVTVLDGAVQVSRGSEPSVRLSAGDEARVERVGHIAKSAAPDARYAVAWRARRLMFPGTPIAEIAAEFNRYNRTQIRVEGETLRNRRMSGVFDADDPSPLIRFLEKDPAVALVERHGEIIVRAR